MAPKKKEAAQKMSLGEFLQEETYGSWADEVEEIAGSQPLPTTDRRTGYGGGYGSSFGNDRGDRGDRGYARDSFPQELPTRPPYTAHLGNLSYNATVETVTEFFSGCDLTSVRIIEDRIENRPKGFAYAEFKDVEGLKQALTLDGQPFDGRNIRIKIAEPAKDRGDRGDRGESARDLSSWERKGPLPDLGRNNDRRNDFGGERRGPRPDAPADDGKVRDFNKWERRGPLSPLPQPERSGSREGSRPRTNNDNRGESFRKARHASPATWGEGREEGSRPPRGEFRERPERPDRPERVPTAAELDISWRDNMKPVAVPSKTPGQSRDGSEAPSSPAPAAAPAPPSRPKLNLQKRTVSEAPGVTSPALPSATESKANPFGGARPIDTAAKEREIAEKKEQAIKEKREADEKAKEERRIAKEAAAKEAQEKAAAAEAAAEAEKEAAAAAAAAAATASSDKAETVNEAGEASKDTSNGGAGDQKVPTKPREQIQNPKSRATESGNWRTASSDAPRGGRGGYQSAPRGGRGGERGGRGGPRGGRFEGGRPPRANGSAPSQAPQQSQQNQGGPASPSDDAGQGGWTTVSKPGRRNQSARV